jgi:uncharacterized protein
MEMKFSMAKYLIIKDYAEELRNKIHQFKESTKTKNAVFLTFISTYGLEENSYSLGLVQNELLLDDLFCERKCHVVDGYFVLIYSKIVYISYR